MEGREDERERNGETINFVPYRSVLRAFKPSAPSPPSADAPPSWSDPAPSPPAVLPPWRQAVGKSFFELTARGAPIPSDRDLSAAEADRYSATLLETFRGCSSVTVGSDIVPVDYVGYEIDRNSAQDGQTDRAILYYRTGSTVAVHYDTDTDSVKPTGRDDVVCWNCRQAGHRAQACSLPRNYAVLSASRNRHLELQELVVPDYALAAYHSQTYDEEDKERRLRLSARFRPDKVSDELGAAVFWQEDAEEDEDPREVAIHQAMMRVSKKRRLWPWLERMSVWGYPPGYHTSYGQYSNARGGPD